jgi:uncharacterized protein YacL
MQFTPYLEVTGIIVIAIFGFAWKNLIEKRFDDLLQLINKNHVETLAHLSEKASKEVCDEKHKRIDNDLNNMGTLIRGK